MRILVTGAGGLVGSALRARAGMVPGHTFLFLDRAACDVTDPSARRHALHTLRPDAVLFCAAFTRVDATVSDPRSHDINVTAPAAWAAEVPVWFLSSNFVFYHPGPHGTDSVPSPQGVYANQKVAAERAVFAAGGHVIRVGWVYGPGGNTFASRLVERLRSGATVDAIADVIVQPTYSVDLAEALLRGVDGFAAQPGGVTHLIGAGECSWYAMALAVQARLRARGERVGAVRPVRLAELSLAEPRPRDGRLSPATLAPWWERVETLVESKGFL